MTHSDNTAIAKQLKSLSHQDFQNFGKGSVWYIRPVSFESDNIKQPDGVALYEADGSRVNIYPDETAALQDIWDNNMTVVMTH